MWMKKKLNVLVRNFKGAGVESKKKKEKWEKKNHLHQTQDVFEVGTTPLS